MISPVYPLQFGVRDQDCVLAEVEESGGTKNSFLELMDTMQQEMGDQVEPGHRKLDFENPTDDDEVTLPPHDRAVIDKLCLIHNEKTG